MAAFADASARAGVETNLTQLGVDPSVAKMVSARQIVPTIAGAGASPAVPTPSAIAAPSGRGGAYLNAEALKKASETAAHKPSGVSGARTPGAAAASGSSTTSYTTLDGRTVTVTKGQAEAYARRRKS